MRYVSAVGKTLALSCLATMFVSTLVVFIMVGGIWIACEAVAERYSYSS